ncbi:MULTISPECIES: AbgT family transporter [unclassified Wenzhouxiangella]|uniref:AbgT family transporter n=1 Tax=unclassified Wenzhouxiangella TaxID=2613841 RepID=UPI000E32C2F9|nr:MULTISPECIES: AbgT family transporter [unclassified Wenzhouxiangella]RFF28757.1 AbgT family transporter [Wenzhouxiangella sp. 15181]RFP67839.1 AbgT family transporter [Wenzhouxiangella sp. 15190]
MSNYDNSAAATARRNWFTRFLDVVEWLGNLLPHPVTLFAILATAMVFLSGFFGWIGLSVEDPRPSAGAGATIEAVSLLNPEGLRRILGGLVDNFVNFAPLGVVLVAMLGVGVAEKSGLLSAMVRGIVLSAPKHVVTVAVVFAGVLSNTASEMGYVVLVPLGGAIFLALGRHPLAGMAAAFAGVSGGYSANLLLGTIDPLLAGITEEAAQLIDPGYTVYATASWYFMIVSTFMITIIGSLVTTFIVEPKLGEYDDSNADPSVLDDSQMKPLTGSEKKGLGTALFTTVALLGLIALLVVPENGILRDPDAGGGFLESSGPFFDSIVAWIFIFFLVVGFAYGKVVGTMRNDRDVIDGMSSAISTLGLYVVLVFFAAQFVAFFGWSNLGLITAVTGAEFLQNIGLTGPLVFVLFIIMCGIVNLSLGSASAQWAVTAPIFVPMLMFIGYSPEVIQTAYRIGDSTTNIITPMMSYFGLILAWATRYDKKFGIGTLIATMLPYSIFYFIGWSLLFLLWVFGLDLPVGPGSPTYYEAP